MRFESKFEFGQTVRDAITGFTGKVVACAFYIADAPSVLVAAKTAEEKWFTAARLMPVKSKKG